MTRFLLVLAVVVFIGSGIIYFTKSGSDTMAQNEGEKQAAAMVAALYSKTQVLPVPQGFLQQAPQQPTTTEASTSHITNANNNKIMNATLHTNQGDITIEFLDKDAPNTVANFIKLTQSGFYNSTKFHRVIKNFMIQGGDPLTKDDSQAARWGTGGPGYQFEDELRPNNKNDIGTIAMANSGPNTNGSQFFINVANNNFLDGKHTVFGKVTAGMDVVAKIENTPTSAGDRPVSSMVIESVVLK